MLKIMILDIISKSQTKFIVANIVMIYITLYKQAWMIDKLARFQSFILSACNEPLIA